MPFAVALSDAEMEAVEALHSGSALLIVRSGPTAGARYLLDTDVTTVGRHPDADIFFDDVTVCPVVTRRSRAPTRLRDRRPAFPQRQYIDGERVDRAVLVNGTEVRIGKFRLTFLVSPADLARAAGA